jgi:hypothetical protein
MAHEKSISRSQLHALARRKQISRPRARRTEAPFRLPEAAAKGKSHHTRTQNPGIWASGRVHCLARLAHLVRIIPTSYTQSMAFRRRARPYSARARPRRQDEAAGLAEATKTPIVQLNALTNTGTGTCRGWAVQCMPGQCKQASTQAG